jgi:1-phosphatidylinositol-4-phosphate 5-kinase
VVGAGVASGKSGAFFMMSPDQQLMAKECNYNEWMLLQRILPAYTEHIEAARVREQRRRTQGGAEFETLKGFCDTLLPRYLGLYCFQAGTPAKEVRMLIMSYVFAGSQTIHRRYDLKGSTYGRRASAKERKKTQPVYKDLDWIDAEGAMHIGAGAKKLLIDSLTEDAKFLRSQGLIDYSLLMGIHDGPPQIRKSEAGTRQPNGITEEGPHAALVYEGHNVVTVTDGERVAYVGIVDVLTPYGARKKAETFLLGWLFCGRDISCQPPVHYSKRFLAFLSSSAFEDKDPQKDVSRNRI